MSIIRRSWVLDSASHTNEVSLDNAPTQEVHDVLTRDGTVRAAFRALAGEQISVYTSVSMMNGAVFSTAAEINNAYFTNDICGGQALSQQKVILATGISLLPTTSGLAAEWGKGSYCTYLYKHVSAPC